MLDDNRVLARTREGQNAVFDDVFLNRSEQRLLRLFNGYTAFGELRARLLPDVDWRHAASELMVRGLVVDLSTAPVEKSVDKQ